MRVQVSWWVGLLTLAVSACSRVQVPPTPANAGVSTRDLEERLTAFAHDSMMGREAGTIWNSKATDYVAAQFRYLGVQPAGEGGDYFQIVPDIRPGDPTVQAAPDHVDVELGDDRVDRYSGMVRVPSGTQQSFLFTGVRNEKDRSLRVRA